MEGKLVNQFMNEKAGMKEVDKQKIAETIERLTAGSPKALHQKQMQEKRALQIAEMLKKCLSFSHEQREEIKRQWWKDMNDIRQTRVLDRYWAHFDFDMFYIACELLDRPELKDKPCAVGGKSSVLCTANYEARKYGLRAAMPSFIALELCPQVVLFEPNFIKYKHFSNIFRDILSTYDPQIQSHGLDQAYVDFTNHLTGKSVAQIEQFVHDIRNRIFEATGLTVSCGVGANKMLAKMASEERKPNDQFVLENDAKTIEKFMAEKKIRKIPGVGPVNEYYLKGLSIETAADVLTNVDVLTICFSRQSAEFFVSAALGLGSIQHEFKERKSVGKSQTFKVTDDINFLKDRLKDLCQQVSMELQELGFLTMNVVFTYQTHNFERRDKTFNLIKYTDQQEPLFQATIDFLKGLKTRVRLLGVKCNNMMKIEDYKKQQLFKYLGNQKKIAQALEPQINSVEHIKQLMRNDVAETGKFLCPICNEMIDCKGNVTIFNKHVDKCLIQGENTNNPEPTVDKNDIKSEARSVQSKSTRPKSKKGATATLTEYFKKK